MQYPGYFDDNHNHLQILARRSAKKISFFSAIFAAKQLKKSVLFSAFSARSAEKKVYAFFLHFRAKRGGNLCIFRCDAPPIYVIFAFFNIVFANVYVFCLKIKHFIRFLCGFSVRSAAHFYALF